MYRDSVSAIISAIFWIRFDMCVVCLQIGPSQYSHSQSLDAPETTPPSAVRSRVRPQSEIIELALPPGEWNADAALDVSDYIREKACSAGEVKVRGFH